MVTIFVNDFDWKKNLKFSYTQFLKLKIFQNWYFKKPISDLGSFFVSFIPLQFIYDYDPKIKMNLNFFFDIYDYYLFKIKMKYRQKATEHRI